MCDEFHFECFEQLIVYAKQRYQFSLFHMPPENGVLYWRHDIDLSPEDAVTMARLENAHSVSSTYFIQTDSRFYSLYDDTVIAQLREIIDLGHAIGLHFHAGRSYLNSFEKCIDILKKERELLSCILEAPINVFSLHNPTEELLQRFGDINYCDMVNTYAHCFREKVRYVSDSNGYWRFQTIAEVLRDDKNSALQVLTHPGWWSAPELTPRSRVLRHLELSHDETMRQYDQLLSRHNRKNE